jgi:hypothetical protein
MDLKGSHKFVVRYDDEIVLDAIRTFVWRRAVIEQKTILIASMLLVISSVYFLFWGEAGWMAGVTLVLGLLPLVFVAVIWRNHKVKTFGRYKSMRDPNATVTVDAQGIDILSDLGRDRLSWHEVAEVWERPRAFMIFNGDGEFNTLPRETMPEPVQAYLRARPVQELREQPIQG